MVAELDITTQDVAKIAEMIDAEIAALVPNWKTDNKVTESSQISSNSEVTGEKSLSHHHDHELDCSDDKSCSSVHGRFADIWGLRHSRSDDGEEQSSKKIKGEWLSENEMRRELRWLKARHRIQLTRVRGQTICETPTEISVTPGASASPPLLYRAISLPVDAVDYMNL